MYKSIIRKTAFLLIFATVLSCIPSCKGNGGSLSEDESGVQTEVNASGEVSQTESGNFIIAKDGTIRVSIVIGSDASSKEKAAARDLKAYLEKITGDTVKIIKDDSIAEGQKYILVGKSLLTEELGIVKPAGYPGIEEVTVKQTGNYLVLIGNDDGNYNGTQFAVNMYLESLGCGWFGEGELWEVVPSLKDIDATGTDIYHTPRFSSRITRVYDGGYDIASRWYLGGDKSITGHWLYQIAPASMYEDHPEWYAYTKGSRNPAGYDYFQFCYSNDEFADYVAEKLIEYFNEHPDLVSMTIAANDGWDEHFCECEKCQSLGNVSDCMVYFANNVARRLAEVYPDRSLQIYSYHMTYEPPENDVPLEPNVEIMFCCETSMTKPLAEDYYKSGYDSITRNTYTCSWRENLEKWLEKTGSANISVWEWYCLSAGRSEWQYVPWVQGNVATRNQDLWEELGVKYIFYDQGPAEGYLEDESSIALRWPLWYVASRAMWGTDMTGEELLKDACCKLFGSAADAMFEYYQKLAYASESCESYSITWVPPTVKQMYEDYEDEIDIIIAKIRAAMEGCSETEKQRIESQLYYWDKTKELLDK
ncbi:MAG: DUF4838 domain-containing protein [Eubacteriales bacterium]|nr:DUF4838 domain-containing protein [Eubacteriales bacterium]